MGIASMKQQILDLGAEKYAIVDNIDKVSLDEFPATLDRISAINQTIEGLAEAIKPSKLCGHFSDDPDCWHYYTAERVIRKYQACDHRINSDCPHFS